MTALSGLVVADFSRLLPGAVATSYLAAFGAEVIKIEQPRTGDYARTLFTKGENPLFGATNRGKKSVELDLKDAGARPALLRLLERTDVLVESFRPGVMARLGLGYDELRDRFPRLIYAALTGYGQTGEMAQLAGHDLNYLALSGVLDLIGSKDGPPVIPGVQLADLAGGAMQAVIGILLALAARERTGRGQMVDAGMLDGVRSMLAVPMAEWQGSGTRPERGNELLSGRFACYQIYPTKDGRWIAVGALEHKFWENLCRELGCPELTGEQFAPEPRQSELKRALAEKFQQRDRDEWFSLLGSRDCCVTPVLALPETGPVAVTPKLTDTPGIVAEYWPKLGEHTHEVLDGDENG